MRYGYVYMEEAVVARACAERHTAEEGIVGLGLQGLGSGQQSARKERGERGSPDKRDAA